MSAQHVVPLNDLIEHGDADCICEPTEVTEGVFIHHSLDGREFFEDDYEGPPMPKERESK